MIIAKHGHGYIATGKTFGLNCTGRGKTQLGAMLEWLKDAASRLEESQSNAAKLGANNGQNQALDQRERNANLGSGSRVVPLRRSKRNGLPRCDTPTFDDAS